MKAIENAAHRANPDAHYKFGRRAVPPLVVKRALSVGEAGKAWLENLDGTIRELEQRWDISVGEALHGGTHAFVACADGRNGEQYALKIDMPEDLGGDFNNAVAALKIANGRGYPRLYAYDLSKKACLIERLGKPINRLGYSTYEQLRIICDALQKVWAMPVTGDIPLTDVNSIEWFRAFIGKSWQELNRPCSRRVIDKALSYLQSREDAVNPAGFVLLHGDAHGGNALKELSGEGFKLIDPDGIVYEKAYDLGVLMREWVDDYAQEPFNCGRERCRYLHELTGVDERAIWEWGYLQTVSTAFVLIKIGQEETGGKMMRTAECWAWEEQAQDPDYLAAVAGMLSLEYGLETAQIAPERRGFYGETWRVRTGEETYFVKIDYWQQHKLSYRDSLSAVQYMIDCGISFVPKIVRTRSGRLFSEFRNGIAAVFEYVPGEMSENYSVAQLYGLLAKVYHLDTAGLSVPGEDFGIGYLEAFEALRGSPCLPANIREALDGKKAVISRYARRLRAFSALCKGDLHGMHITHGDAGGNCLMQDGDMRIVDWDSVMLAPIERDAWIFISDEQQMDEAAAALRENGIDYEPEQARLCYYCYSFFFYYLDEYIKALESAGREQQRRDIEKGLLEYLAGGWIYERLDAADRVAI